MPGQSSQVSILSGVKADAAANMRASYPVNLQPVVTQTGLSGGFLRTFPGITQLATGPATGDRGSINWLGNCYRVIGSKLVKIDGSSVTTLGDVGNDSHPVTFDYGPDRLAIASNFHLFYWDGLVLTQVVDPDLGAVVDMCWVDGYYMTTDFINLIVTDLNDPYSVNPLHYGSSEADPDPIIGLRKVRDEIYVLNLNTIENFQNVGGTGFPFQRNASGLIPKGVIGTHACAYYLDTFAFVGNGRNEAPSVWLADFGKAINISTPEIDRLIQAVATTDHLLIEVESIQMLNEQQLLIHLPTQTLVYCHTASQAAQEPVWFILQGPVNIYNPRHFCFAQDKWVAGHISTNQIGYLNEAIEQQFGLTVTWQFDTRFVYNANLGGILQWAELTGLPGRMPSAVNPTASISWTRDGQTYNTPVSIHVGDQGENQKRMQWRPKTRFGNYLGMRFSGSNTALASFGRLQVGVEGLNV